MGTILDGQKFNNGASRCRITELFNQRSANLKWLSAAEMHIINSRSPELAHPNEETMIVNLRGAVTVYVDNNSFILEHYDMLYVPVGSVYAVEHDGDEEAWIYCYRAVGDTKYPVYHAKYKECREDEKRIRHLNRKVVYKMFDVSEEANKFMVGYTFYQDRTRAWPPHNHTDQEEVYSFIEGTGAMEVYEEDEHKTFVTSVSIGDHITIPLMNYHPVFSHDEPLCFIWCISGARYWVGDKNKDFMDASVDKLTT